jgi:hypothetical protein
VGKKFKVDEVGEAGSNNNTQDVTASVGVIQSHVTEPHSPGCSSYTASYSWSA